MAKRKKDKMWDKYNPATNPKWAWFECPVDTSSGYEPHEGERWFRNGYYQVFISPYTEMYHLSIKTHDRRPSRDWRDFQQIKNDLVGTEHEGLELYPAESRLVDTANQYHLWVLKDKGRQIPTGFSQGRMVSNDEQGASKQRPRPTFSDTPAKMNQDQNRKATK